MSITDKKGINVTSGFKLISGQPIDARFNVEDETELQSIIDNGAVYEGLHVWVKSLGKEKVWNGTEFTEIQASGESSETTKAIVDVDKLPHLIDGAAVQGSGLVEKIYFNTKMNSVDIVKILDTLEYYDLSSFGFSKPSAVVCVSDDLSTIIIIANYSDTDSKSYSIMYVSPEEYKLIYDYYESSSESDITDDWKGIENIDVNVENALDVLGSQFGVSNQNEKIKNLISTTPFEDYSKTNKDVIYRLIIDVEKNEYKYFIYDGENVKEVFVEKAIVDVNKMPYLIDEGTAVPYSGLINKVYINQNINAETLFNIVNSLEYVDFSGFILYVLLIDGSDLFACNALVILKQEDNSFGLLREFTDGSLEDIAVITQNEITWAQNISEIAFGVTTLVGDIGPAMGMTLQNDKLKDFISITPFENWDNVNDKAIYKVQEDEQTIPKYYLLDKNTKNILELGGGSLDTEIIDDYAYEDSSNLITSGGVYQFVNDKLEPINDSLESINANLESIEAIIDVEELPSHNLIGTTVPNSGELQTVYFNKKLTKQKVVETVQNNISSLKLYDYSDSLYLVTNTSGNVNGIGSINLVYTLSSDNTITQLEIQTYIDGSYQTMFAYSDDGSLESSSGIDGWNLLLPSYLEINSTAKSRITFGTTSVNVGTKNSLLSLIFSSTPFVEEKTFNENLLYRLTVNNQPQLWYYSNGWIQIDKENIGIVEATTNSALDTTGIGNIYISTYEYSTLINSKISIVIVSPNAVSSKKYTFIKTYQNIQSSTYEEMHFMCSFNNENRKLIIVNNNGTITAYTEKEAQVSDDVKNYIASQVGLEPYTFTITGTIAEDENYGNILKLNSTTYNSIKNFLINETPEKLKLTVNLNTGETAKAEYLFPFTKITEIVDGVYTYDISAKLYRGFVASHEITSTFIIHIDTTYENSFMYINDTIADSTNLNGAELTRYKQSKD